MGESTKIEWCDSTVNGSSGCNGCELAVPGIPGTCYARELHETRWAKSLAVTHPEHYAKSFFDVKMIPGRFHKAARWKDLRGTERPDKPWLNGLPRMIFVGDMGDILSKDVTDAFLEAELLAAMQSKEGQRHFWMLLTKRPKRLAELSKKWGGLPDNCMAMTSVTNQQTAEVRVPELLEVQCRWRGLSCEPLLGAVNLREINGALNTWRSMGACDVVEAGMTQLVIAGGESGPNARPMHPAWVRSLQRQCADAEDVSFFFKQWGEFAPEQAVSVDGSPASTTFLNNAQIHICAAGERIYRVGKHRAGCLLDGLAYRELPKGMGRL